MECFSYPDITGGLGFGVALKIDMKRIDKENIDLSELIEKLYIGISTKYWKIDDYSHNIHPELERYKIHLYKMSADDENVERVKFAVVSFPSISGCAENDENHPAHDDAWHIATSILSIIYGLNIDGEDESLSVSFIDHDRVFEADWNPDRLKLDFSPPQAGMKHGLGGIG